jgi:hypothetical protein
MPEDQSGSGDGLKISTQNAKGPEAGEDDSTYCPDCNRVVWSVWKYGPMTPREHNKFFCICGGPLTGEVKQRMVIYDVKDVEKNGSNKSDK